MYIVAPKVTGIVPGMVLLLRMVKLEIWILMRHRPANMEAQKAFLGGYVGVPSKGSCG